MLVVDQSGDMALHALENVDEAFDVTREFLLPVSVGRWLKLAVVAFFVGATSFPTTGFNAGGSTDPDPAPGGGGEFPVEVPAVVSENLVAIAVGLVVAAVLLGLAFAVVAAIMEFVLVESLRNGEVTLRRYWGRRWGQGLRLFGFRLAIGLPVVALFGGWLLVLVLPLILGGDPLLPLGLFFLLIPVVLLASIGYWLVNTLTTVFVVPIMISEGTGVLAAWRRLWGSMRTATNQYLGFVVLWLVLTFVAGLIAAFAGAALAALVLLPLALVGVVTYLTVSFSSTVGIAILAILAVLAAVALVVAWALVQVPVLTYLRYYALLVLGDVEPEFDLVAERRGGGPEQPGETDAR
jgi:hypothetical protein